MGSGRFFFNSFDHWSRILPPQRWTSCSNIRADPRTNCCGILQGSRKNSIIIFKSRFCFWIHYFLHSFFDRWPETYCVRRPYMYACPWNSSEFFFRVRFLPPHAFLNRLWPTTCWDNLRLGYLCPLVRSLGDYLRTKGSRRRLWKKHAQHGFEMVRTCFQDFIPKWLL